MARAVFRLMPLRCATWRRLGSRWPAETLPMCNAVSNCSRACSKSEDDWLLSNRNCMRKPHLGEAAGDRYRASACQDRRREQRNHDFVMACEGEAATRAGDRTADDVGERAIGLQKIEIRRCEVFQFVAEITNNGHRFQEDLRQQHRRAQI